MGKKGMEKRGIGKGIFRVVLLFLVILAIAFTSYKYWDFVWVPLNQKSNLQTFKNLSHVGTDDQGNVYVISDSKQTITKWSADGTLVYKLTPPTAANPQRQYLAYSDFATSPAGDLYVVCNVMDTNGLVVLQDEILHYMANGQLDPNWKTYAVNQVNNLRTGVVKSVAYQNKELYFTTLQLVNANDPTQGQLLQLHKYDAKEQDEVMFHTTLPADRYVAEISGVDEHSMVYTTKNGQLFKLDSGLIYPKSAPVDVKHEDAPFPEQIQRDENDNVYFIDQYGQNIKKLNINSPTTITTVITSDKATKGVSDSSSDLQDMAIAHDGSLVVGTADGNVVRVSTAKQVTPLGYSATMHLYHWLFFVAAALAAACLIWALKILYVNIWPYSLLAKQILIPLPLILITAIGISIWSYSVMKSAIDEEIYRGTVFMAHDGQNLVNGDLLLNMKSSSDYMNADYQQMYNKLTFADRYGKFYSTVYKLEGNTLYNIIDDNVKMFEPIYDITQLDSSTNCQIRYGPNQVWKTVYDLKTVFAKNEDGTLGNTVMCHASDENGDWMYTIGPIYTSDRQQIVGAYETGINTSAYYQRLNQISTDHAWMLGGLAVLVTLIFVIGTRALVSKVWALQEGAQEIAREQWGITVPIRSQDEMAELEEVFNKMSHKVQDSITEISALSEAYRRFVPQELVDLLGKTDIVDVQLGDQVQKNMSVLVTNIQSFYDLAKEMKPEENFRFMNQFLQYVSPAIFQNGGLINKFLGSGVLALFPNHPEKALQAAIDMRKALKSYNEDRKQKNRQVIDIGIAIHNGPMVLGIIGTSGTSSTTSQQRLGLQVQDNKEQEKDRMEVNVLSDDVNFASVLEELSNVVRATLLMPASLYQAIPGSETYASRSLGLLQIAGRNEPVEIYDVYEADTDDVKKRKDKTKSLFADGIKNYQQGRYDDARDFFLDVIKLDPDDKIAVKYFQVSNTLSETGTPAGFKGALEISAV